MITGNGLFLKSRTTNLLGMDLVLYNNAPKVQWMTLPFNEFGAAVKWPKVSGKARP